MTASKALYVDLTRLYALSCKTDRNENSRQGGRKHYVLKLQQVAGMAQDDKRKQEVTRMEGESTGKLNRICKLSLSHCYCSLATRD